MPYVFIVIVVLLITAAFFCAFYIYSIKPNTKPDRKELLKPFCDSYVAHRGLFNHTNAPENSLAAFRRAVQAGFAVELDVQMTKDGQIVVFHDGTLKRMCGVNKKISEINYEELKSYTLENSNEYIPLLREVLDVIQGRVPILAEIKAEGDVMGIVKVFADIMADYKGTYCMQSFHPLVLWWYRRNMPEIARGQLSTDYWKNKIKSNFFAKIFLSNLMLNFISKPDFISYNYKYVRQPSFSLCRRLYHPICAAWTIRGEHQLNKARRNFQIFIFDSFVPNKTENEQVNMPAPKRRNLNH